MDPLVIAATRPVIALAKRILRPVLSGLEEEARTKTKAAFDSFFDGYRDYLARSYVRHSMFTSLAIRNEQRRLQDLYLPLTLTFPDGNDAVRIDDYPAELLDQIKSVLVVDTAGMGKTTLLKFVFLKCIDVKAAVPIYVELRRLSKKISLQDYLLEELAGLGKKPQQEMLFRFLHSGRILLLLDGYDEIAEQDRADVTHDLLQFMRRTGNNRFLMTSRSEIGLASFSEFRRFEIRPLCSSEAFSLIRKYDSHGVAESLINQLQREEIHGVHEFLVNPLLVSLLYRSYEFKQTIPLKRHVFYSQVFEALFESHDLAKDGGEFSRKKRSGLDMDRFDKFMRVLAAESYRAGVIETTRIGWVSLIESSKLVVGDKKLSANALLHDLTHAVPLMTLEGGYYRWTHRSIQEYFAACNICYDQEGRTSEIFKKRYSRPDFESHANLLILAGAIDGFSFRSSIGAAMARELLLALDELEARPIPGVDAATLAERYALVVGREFYLLRDDDFTVSNKKCTQPVEIISESEDLVKSATEKLLKFSRISQQVNSKIHFGHPNVGEIQTPLAQRMEAFFGKAELPFLVRVSERVSLPLKLDFGAADIWRVDESKGPGCQAEHVSALNDRLSQVVHFRFDAIVAREYLSDLEEETAARNRSGW